MREPNREEKALISRRFEPYFRKRNIDAWDYFRSSNSVRKQYERSDWIKLSFDGRVKRVNMRPGKLDDIYKLAR